MINNEYKLREITPSKLKCGIAACPAIYEIEELTPENMKCWPLPGCPAIYKDNRDNYLIVGKIVDAKEFGLEKKVGKGEILVSVPKRLIDERRVE